MPLETPELKLYKKDPATDGASNFDVKTMMNDNWDKLDADATTNKNHRNSIANPHNTTAAQVGAYTKAEADTMAAAKAKVVQDSLDSHTANKTNPHAVTAAQVGAYTKAEADTMAQGKAAAEAGKVQTNLTNHIGTGGTSHATAVANGAAGFMTGTDKDKLDKIAAGAEVNQNAFANILVGTTTIAADAKQDTVEIVAGNKIVLTPDATGDKLTIATAADVETTGGAQTKVDNHANLTNNPHSVTAAQVGAYTKGEADGKYAPIGHVGAGGDAHANATTAVDGFMSAADKTKLNGIATGANNYTHPTGDGNSHVPATGTANNGKVLKAGATANSAAWGNVSFSELTGKPTTLGGYGITDAAPSSHVGAGGSAHAAAVANGANGFMTGTDKAKLDGIATGANNYTHPSSHPASMITQDANYRFVTDTEKSNWNAKETTSGAQSKANAAEANAKAYAVNMVSSGSTADPNTTQEAYILTNHANSPGGGLYWHIQTYFYSTKTGNRAQVAISYNASGAAIMKIRQYYGTAWTAWKEVANTDLVTTAEAGLMSAADKSKLNGIATGANNYTHPSTHPASMITTDAGRRFISDDERALWNRALSAAGSDTNLVFQYNNYATVGIPAGETRDYVVTYPVAFSGGTAGWVQLLGDTVGSYWGTVMSVYSRTNTSMTIRIRNAAGSGTTWVMFSWIVIGYA